MSSISDLRLKITAVANALRNKLGIKNEMTLDEMVTAIEGMENPPLQEKEVTTNGEVIPDEGYYGLSKVNVNVPTSGGSSGGGSGGSSTPAFTNGFTINFYNHDKVLIESHSALCGMFIDAPMSYEAETWQNANGYVNSFPLTVDIDKAGSVYDLYAGGAATCAQVLYSAYGVDVAEYPYVLIYALSGDTQDGYQGKTLYFAPTWNHYFGGLNQPYKLNLGKTLKSPKFYSSTYYSSSITDVIKDVIQTISKEDLVDGGETTLSPVGSGYTCYDGCTVWHNAGSFVGGTSYIQDKNLNETYTP